ncbi:uncharacterized protein LOC133206127 [Saccostrea echinata]|uniref:uncharacterized protein LOC133206127 n=1 Tax=Saccostrea echinata TaxID=191078 RepID=UPI002A823ADA|nr:uncharacterized protein LOC133206127 [Saccostrea echinata]
MEIVYAELVFDEGSKNSCHTAFCVFEEFDDDKKRQSASSGEISMVDVAAQRISTISTSSDMSIQTFVEMEDELDMEECVHFLNEKWKEDDHDTCTYVCSGITETGDGKIIITTKSGEMALYGASGKLLSLKEFSETFEGLTKTSKDEVAVSCGYSIRFYKVEKSKVHEEAKKCIDFKYTDMVKVHDIHYSDGSFIILCKIFSQSSIKKIDMKGNTLQLVYQTSTSVDSFCYFGETLFVIEKDQRKISAMKQNGDLSWELTLDYSPRYLTIAGEDRVVVSLSGRPDLKCLTMTGSVLSSVDTGLDPSQTPLLLCYSTESNSMYFCPEEVKKIKSSRKNPFSKILSSMKLD